MPRPLNDLGFKHLRPLNLLTGQKLVALVVRELGNCRLCEASLLGSSGVSLDLRERAVTAYCRDLLRGRPGFGEPAESRLAQTMRHAAARKSRGPSGVRYQLGETMHGRTAIVRDDVRHSHNRPGL